jgi:CBS domain-containing protein
MAALDPVAFVRSIPPFDALPAAAFAEVARALEIGFYPAGTRLASVGESPLEHLYIVRTGAVRVERHGKTLQVLEEGESFGFVSLITGRAALDVVVEDDCLAYLLPAPEFQRLLAHAPFATHFAVGLSERLKGSLAPARGISLEPDLSVEVNRLVGRAPVWIDPGLTIGDAARVMRAERISSVLVRTEPPSIVTDRDFRNRVLADGLGPRTPVLQVCSQPLRVVAASARLHEAWTALLETGAHHLPVERDGQIVGMVTAGDLLRASAQGPVAVLRSVERLGGRGSLGGYADRVADMAGTLLAGGLDAPVIAGFVARLNDAVVGRILEWAEAELGPAPAPYAWLVFGSEGRMEQTLLTDQDNALAYADAGGRHRAWFQALADHANADLLAAGFPPCPGGRMARLWHGTESSWVSQIDECIRDRPHDAAIFFDTRRGAGTLPLDALEAALARGRSARLLVRSLARHALAFTPPPSLLLRLRATSSVVNLKRHGLTPIVALARCYAIEAGLHARGTLDRLDGARDAGLMAASVHADMSEAFRFLLGLRLRVRLRRRAEHLPSSDEVTLAELEPTDRSRLKESLRGLRAWQELAAYRYQPDL